MSDDRKRMALLTLIMALACASAVGIAMYILYDTHLEEERERLVTTAHSQARLMEEVASFDAKYSNDYPGGSLKATLSQIIAAHEDYRGFGKTGEFTLARREGDLIVFQFRHRHDKLITPEPVPFDSELAEPMRRALSGLSGTMIGLDYRGEVVLAAYEPVAQLNLGIVSKIDLAEERAPFIRAGLITAGIAVVVVLVGVMLFIRISNPMIARLETHARELGKEVEERKRAQEELKKSYSLIDAVIDGTGDAVFVKDEQGRYLLVNEVTLLAMGKPEGDVIGKDDTAIFPPEISKKIMDLDREIMASGETRTVEEMIMAGDDEQTWLSVKSPYLDRQGNVIGIIGISHDITQKKQLESQIQHTQKLESLGVLAGGIAHDFNNLLMGIMGNADLALLDLSPSSPARLSIEEIQKASQRAAELCKQMLAYSGRGRFVVVPLDISKVVEEITHLLEVSISKKAFLKFDLTPNLPAIEADATQLRQVVMNLIINASEAIGDKSGIIRISTGAVECDRKYLDEYFIHDELAEGVYVYVEVSDTGCGMDEDTRAKIFDPFFTTKFTGRGLGLAAVLGIVRGHKGVIRVYSEPGKGSTIKVMFPASDQAAHASSPENKKLEEWRASGTVLLVDDEETVLAVTRMMLERIGFKVLTAPDGREGVKTFGEHCGDITLVLLDMTMPHMDGEEAFREIRKIKSDACVILSSGYNEQEAISRFSGKGLAGFLQKPYQLQALTEKIREVMDSNN